MKKIESMYLIMGLVLTFILVCIYAFSVGEELYWSNNNSAGQSSSNQIAETETPASTNSVLHFENLHANPTVQ